MSLLTTFGILFETDAEKAKREIDEVDQSLSSTEKTANDTADSFDELGGAVDESADSFLGLSEGLVSAAAGLVVVTGLFAGITSQAMATDEIGKFSNAIGVNVKDVGAWGEAVKRAGGDVSSFMGSLESLTDQLTDIELTGGGEASQIFARLGVDAVGAGGKVKSAFEVLPELADSFQKLSKTESFAFGKKLGLDQGTILLLQQGRIAVEELVLKQKQLGVATKEDAAAAAEFNDALADSQQTFANLFTSAGTTILPLLTSMMKGFDAITIWMGNNKTLVSGFFIGAAAAISFVYLPAILSAATATLVAMAPFLLIGAAIAAVGIAFAILFEDVVAYIGGQESFIGDLAKKYEWFGRVVDAVISAVKFVIKELSEFVGEMFLNMGDAADTLKNVFSFVFGDIGALFSGFGDHATGIVDIIISAFEMLGVAISSALGFIASPIETTKALLDDLADSIPDLSGVLDDAFSGTKSFFGFDDDEVSANLDKAIKITSSIDNNPLNGQTSASIVNSQQSSNRINNVTVGGSTINTQATDAAGVASAVGDNLNSQISMAIEQFDDAEDF